MLGRVRSGLARNGLARCGRHGSMTQHQVWLGKVWQDAQRRSGHGVVRQGLAGMAGSGRARIGVARLGAERQATRGGDREIQNLVNIKRTET